MKTFNSSECLLREGTEIDKENNVIIHGMTTEIRCSKQSMLITLQLLNLEFEHLLQDVRYDEVKQF